MNIIKLSHLDSLKKIGIASQYFENYHNRKRNMHGIDVVLISVIIRGRGIHFQGDQSFPESGSSVAVTHYGEYHSIITAPDETMDIVNIYLDLKKFALPSLPPEMTDILSMFLAPHPAFIDLQKRLARIEFDDMNLIASLALNIERELREKNEGYLAAAMDYFRIFLIECCRQVKKSGTALSAPLPEAVFRLEKLRRYLEKNYLLNDSLDELSEIAGLQKNYLCRKFKDYTGKTLFEYRTALRIQRSVQLLVDGNDKLTVIACECGYSDVSYFNRIFRSVMKCTPYQYRRTLLK